ncbi:MAG: TMEM43 family protein [Terrimicrobiaceae bacterium]
MDNDTVTVTTSKSWFSRIGSAISGIIFGVILFLGSFLLLTWNEGRAIHRAKTLEAGASQVITVSANGRLAENEGKLVHLNGEAVAEGPVTDPVFGVTAAALKLRRDVEMYQWKQTEKSETKKKLGGGEETTTTYSYAKDWSSSLIDSSQFHAPAGHSNPDSIAVESDTFVAGGIHVGAFDLPESLVALINNYAPRPVTAGEAEKAAKRQSADIRAGAGGALFVGEDPANPKVGDLRVKFETAAPGPVSIVAGQVGNTLEPFAIGDLGTIELLKTGTFSAAAMFQQEKEGNAMLTWILRLVGFVMMLFGLLLITKVISVVASVIPFLGDIVGAGTGLLAIAVALPLTLGTIALAWLAYRPLIGIPLFLAAAGCVFFASTRLLKARKKA